MTEACGTVNVNRTGRISEEAGIHEPNKGDG